MEDSGNDFQLCEFTFKASGQTINQIKWRQTFGCLECASSPGAQLLNEGVH